MSKASFERKAIGILYDFQKSRKVWGDLVSDGLTQANALVNVQLQQGYVLSGLLASIAVADEACPPSLPPSLFCPFTFQLC